MHNETNYDKQANFYYSNLVNSIILFTLKTAELERLAGPVFDPVFELESEIDYAYIPALFQTIFRNDLIDLSLKPDLLSFKNMVDNIPPEIWDWEFIDENPIWIDIRKEANRLLDKLKIHTRIYNDDYTTIYKSDGTLLKKGKNTLL